MVKSVCSLKPSMYYKASLRDSDFFCFTKVFLYATKLFCDFSPAFWVSIKAECCKILWLYCNPPCFPEIWLAQEKKTKIEVKLFSVSLSIYPDRIFKSSVEIFWGKSHHLIFFVKNTLTLQRFQINWGVKILNLLKINLSKFRWKIWAR